MQSVLENLSKLDVSISKVRFHNKLLMQAINDNNYTEVFPHLCNTLRKFIIKLEADSKDTAKNYLVRLVSD